MKHLLPKAALATLGVALIAQTASAQYAPGDLILGVRQLNSTVSYELDLGQGSLFTAGTSYAWATSADLSALFGSSGTPILWSVAGTLGNASGNGTGARATWVTADAPGGPGTSTPWLNGQITGSFPTAVTKISSMGTGYQSTLTPGLLPGSVYQANTAANSYTSFTTGANTTGNPGQLQYTRFSPTIENSLAPSVYSDLYKIAIGATGSSGIDEGDFYFDANGVFHFNGVPVPEPTTYGLIAAAGLLCLTLGQQFRRKVQA